MNLFEIILYLFVFISTINKANKTDYLEKVKKLFPNKWKFVTYLFVALALFIKVFVIWAAVHKIATFNF